MSTPGSSETRRPDIVCVLGMHRSGTSLLARILNLLGLCLGSDVSVQPAEDNAKGHWEHTDIVSLNDAILQRYGGSWDEPPRLPPDWESAALIDDLRERAQRIIEDQFAGVHLWGWKDPRSCLTLPFWQQLLPQMRYVICLRNPVDVALSLRHRNSFSAEKSSGLWFQYVNSAFEHTEGKPRLVVFYEDLINHWSRELQRLADFLGKPELAAQADVQEATQEFVEKSLQHHRTSIVQATANPRIALRTRALYIAQRITVSFGRKEIDAQGFDQQIETALDILNSYSLNTSGQANPLMEQLAEMGNQLAERENQLVEREKTIGELQTLSAELGEQNRALQWRAENAETMVASLERLVTSKDHQIIELDKGLTERDRHIASLYHTIAKFEAAPLRRAIRVTRRGIAKLASSLRFGSRAP